MSWYLRKNEKNKFTPLSLFKTEKSNLSELKKAYLMSKNEKYFLPSLRYASCHAALSSLWSSGRITRNIRFGAQLAHRLTACLRRFAKSR